jgi:hypothetical protein
MIGKRSTTQWNQHTEKRCELLKIRPQSATLPFSTLLDALGDVKGKRLLDFGYSKGRIARAFDDLGAIVQFTIQPRRWLRQPANSICRIYADKAERQTV